MSDELKKAALDLYRPPFVRKHGYIFDSAGQMVADDAGANATLRVRGWGRIGYLPNAEGLQDQVGDLIALALTEYWERAASVEQHTEIESLRKDSQRLRWAASSIENAYHFADLVLENNGTTFEALMVDIDAHCGNASNGGAL
ncbi:hypothetical protein ACQUFY_04560 [Robbsia andropogonis]|uniref:hypothetical protein n=1 Tax=Robbsia andropogonis TaxID=28092 RepID=UPI003D1BE748